MRAMNLEIRTAAFRKRNNKQQKHQRGQARPASARKSGALCCTVSTRRTANLRTSQALPPREERLYQKLG